LKNQQKKKKLNGIFKDMLNIYQVHERLNSLIEVGTIELELNLLCDLLQKDHMKDF
jgi:hypothetical protein